MAYNNNILKDILFKKDFIILEKKNYLVNAGYYNTNYFLYPYYNIRYYLKKLAIAGQRLITKEELFNFYYFSH